MAYNSYKPQLPRESGETCSPQILDTNESEEYKVSNNERFNKLINSCCDPQGVYNALLLLAAKPGVQQANNAAEKSQIIIGEILTLTDVAQGNKKAS